MPQPRGCRAAWHRAAALPARSGPSRLQQPEQFGVMPSETSSVSKSVPINGIFSEQGKSTHPSSTHGVTYGRAINIQTPFASQLIAGQGQAPRQQVSPALPTGLVRPTCPQCSQAHCSQCDSLATVGTSPGPGWQPGAHRNPPVLHSPTARCFQTQAAAEDAYGQQLSQPQGAQSTWPLAD